MHHLLTIHMNADVDEALPLYSSTIGECYSAPYTTCNRTLLPSGMHWLYLVLWRLCLHQTYYTMMRKNNSYSYDKSITIV